MIYKPGEVLHSMTGAEALGPGSFLILDCPDELTLIVAPLGNGNGEWVFDKSGIKLLTLTDSLAYSVLRGVILPVPSPDDVRRLRVEAVAAAQESIAERQRLLDESSTTLKIIRQYLGFASSESAGNGDSSVPSPVPHPSPASEPEVVGIDPTEGDDEEEEEEDDDEDNEDGFEITYVYRESDIRECAGTELPRHLLFDYDRECETRLRHAFPSAKVSAHAFSPGDKLRCGMHVKGISQQHERKVREEARGAVEQALLNGWFHRALETAPSFMPLFDGDEEEAADEYRG